MDDWRAWLVLIGVTTIIIALVVRLVVNKVKGKSSCSCGCGGCAMREICHSQSNKKGDKASQTTPNEQEIGGRK